MNFEEKSYKQHEAYYAENFDDKLVETYGHKDTVDYWRHARMYASLDPIIKSYPKSSWLTIGDGRYGTDANYIATAGIEKVVASDISETFLAKAKQDGFIKEYSIQNAEKMTFDNDSFDFVVIKEAYHHFPRPMIAVYEMLRVAKQAIVLLEPQDEHAMVPAKAKTRLLFRWLVQSFKNIVKGFLGKPLFYEHGQYEPVGNYVYTISKREIEKIALGLNYPMVAFRELNDFYEKGVEFEKASPDSALFNKVKNEIAKIDEECKKGTLTYQMLVAVIFKEAISPEARKTMEQAGYTFSDLPRNPYLKP
jgi:ubiquinone/menaquinone biosynthesis C-methylase UbiE